jgi:hypothetical protein
MRRVLTAAAVGLCLLAAGCGDGRLRTQGRLLKGGRPFAPAEGEAVQILFVPIPPEGKPPTDYYAAEVDQEAGTFRPAGKDGKGMPPGRYRVAVELMKRKKDQFEGKFDAERSPFVVEVDAKTPEIVIDLDHPPQL